MKKLFIILSIIFLINSCSNNIPSAKIEIKGHDQYNAYIGENKLFSANEKITFEKVFLDYCNKNNIQESFKSQEIRHYDKRIKVFINEYPLTFKKPNGEVIELISMTGTGNKNNNVMVFVAATTKN